MKKYLLPSALILALGLGIALAQNISKSVQLSQDATGAIGYDTLNNAYFPNHVLFAATTTPAINTGSGTAATILGTDELFAITGGGVTTGLVSAVFATAFNAAPRCLVSTSGGTPSTIAYNTATTGINFTSIVGNAVLNVFCSGTK